MNSVVFGTERPNKTLLAWQLALLRFAVTLDNNDRLAVLAVAGEIDRLGLDGGGSDFRFFRKTSVELCASIANPDEAGSQRLHQYLVRIDDERLRRSFAAATGHDGRLEKPSVKRPAGPGDRLWHGLASRALPTSNGT
ncbi:hypothetical protein [Bradyrhizobium sp. dw_78]|uniref:hypothetical protein n=1 Tax=Bradyrhizobium sp. dw_78 TaxID=2719793 RepID=UPI001BD1D976|nr:hypothetical protein [Bradyrhizobium sp. dw_78]